MGMALQISVDLFVNRVRHSLYNYYWSSSLSRSLLNINMLHDGCLILNYRIELADRLTASAFALEFVAAGNETSSAYAWNIIIARKCTSGVQAKELVNRFITSGNRHNIAATFAKRANNVLVVFYRFALLITLFNTEAGIISLATEAQWKFTIATPDQTAHRIAGYQIFHVCLKE